MMLNGCKNYIKITGGDKESYWEKRFNNPDPPFDSMEDLKGCLEICSALLKIKINLIHLQTDKKDKSKTRFVKETICGKYCYSDCTMTIFISILINIISFISFRFNFKQKTRRRSEQK